ncbi:MAG: c-type cytochrome [Pseudomonadales bacterium]
MNAQTQLAGAAFAILLLGAAACEASDAPDSYDGRNLYLGYCASCHGAEGDGDGPVAPALAAALPDLRTIAVRRGSFPRGWVVDVIDGRAPRAAHGTPDMPVWGWQFQLQEGSATDARARIDALVEHLRTIQAEG